MITSASVLLLPLLMQVIQIWFLSAMQWYSQRNIFVTIHVCRNIICTTSASMHWLTKSWTKKLFKKAVLQSTEDVQTKIEYKHCATDPRVEFFCFRECFNLIDNSKFNCGMQLIFTEEYIKYISIIGCPLALWQNAEKVEFNAVAIN